jgi:hypothetical protein
MVREALAAKAVSPDIIELLVARTTEIGRESSKEKEAGSDEAAPAGKEEAAASGSGPREKTAQAIFLSQSEVELVAEKMLQLFEEAGSRQAFKKIPIQKIGLAISSVPRTFSRRLMIGPAAS